MYGAKEQRASTDTASLRSMARLSAYAKVADGAERPPSVVAAGVLISDSGAAVGLLLLTFWEIPRWCRADGRCECVWDVDEPSRCPYPTFDIAYVDEYVAVAAQVACAGVVAAHLACNAVAVGRARFFGPGGMGWPRAPPAAVYFGGFLVLGFFFMMNLLLATVYNAYTDERESASRRRARSAANITALEPRWARPTGVAGALDDLFAELNAHRDVVHLGGRGGAPLRGPDTSGDGLLHRDEFERVVDVLQEEADRKKAGLSDDELPSAPWRARARRLVEAASFELGVDALLLLNAVLIAYQTKDELLGTAASDASDVRGVLEALESGFAVLYVAEASLKVAGLGLTQYAANYRNRFDGLVTLASLAAAAYVAYPNSYDNPVLVRYVVMLRLLRLVRLIVALPEFQVLFCVTFFFATVGAALFQGLINADPGAPQLAQLEGTDFYAQGYLPLNFNDYESGFVALFCVLVVNNWFVLVEGFVAVSDEWTGRAFFLAFYLVGVLVLLNVVVAFILDAFISELDKTRSLRRAASR
ncbi:hypothetical protein JL721_11496 [Aureococcus anophagefferens]|nr:hypothetical protein JL721_11496 [Aureococcus anophagefferens]